MKKNMIVFVAAFTIAVLFIVARGVFMKYNYTRYSGKDFSFEYPYGWQIRESKGRTEKYFQVHVFGPPEKMTGFRPSITVTVYPKQDSTVEFASSSAFASRSVERFKKLRQFKLESDKTVDLPFKVLSRDVKMSYVLMLPLYDINAKEALLRDRIIFFERGPHIYVLGYKNLASLFASNQSAFTRLIKTLSFKA